MLSVSLPLHLGTPSGKTTGLFGNFSQISLCLYLYLYLYLFLYLYFTVEFRLGPLFVPPCSGSRLAVGFFRQLIVTKQVQTNTNQTQNKYNSNKHKTNTKPSSGSAWPGFRQLIVTKHPHHHHCQSHQDHCHHNDRHHHHHVCGSPKGGERICMIMLLVRV